MSLAQLRASMGQPVGGGMSVFISIYFKFLFRSFQEQE